MIIRQKLVMQSNRTWSPLRQKNSTFNYAVFPLPGHTLWCQCLFNSVGGILCLQTFMKLLFHPNFEILCFCLFSQGFAHCLFKKLTNLSKCINERWDAPYQFLPLLATFIQSKHIFGRFLTLRLQLCKFLSCLWSLS